MATPHFVFTFARITWTWLCGLCLLTASILPAHAALTVISGANLRVTQGTVSEFITIRVTDESGGPVVGASLAFSLTGPDCESVSIAVLDVLDNAVSNAEGLVQVRLNAAASLITSGPYQLSAQRADRPEERITVSLVVTRNNALFAVGGQCQTVAANEPSAPVLFQMLDNQGDPRSLIDVRFALQNAAGETIDGLLILSGTTDENGQVQTTVSSTQAGSFSVMAEVQTAATYNAQLPITVEPGLPGTVVPIQGAEQRITAGRLSEPMVFVLRDVFGNLATGRAEQTVNFSVLTPSGATTTSGLSRLSDLSNAAGEVSTQFTAPNLEGEYEIKASLAGRPTAVGSATIIVQTALPGLPSLGFGLATDANLNPLATATRATFNGGFSVNGGRFQQESVISATANLVTIHGLINVDPTHVGQTADIFVLLAYTPAPVANNDTIIYMVTPNGLPVWEPDSGVSTIEAFSPDVTLQPGELIELYSGPFPYPGLIQILFGYRLLASTSYVFHIEHFVTALVQ